MYKKDRTYKHFSKIHKDEAHKIIAEIVANEGKNTDFLEDFGFRIVAPMVLSYTSFVVSEIKKRGISTLVCIARDGFFVKDCIEVLFDEIKTIYAYAPRYQYYLSYYDLNYQTDFTIPKMICSFCGIETKRQRHFIKKHKNEIEEKFQNNKEKFQFDKYLQNLLNGENNFALVDGPSAKRTSQKFIQKTLGKDILTFYLQLLPKAKYKKFQSVSFLKFPKHFIINRLFRSKFMEVIFTSPYGSAVFVKSDGTPTYSKGGLEMANRKAKYKSIRKGMLKFFHILSSYDCNLDIFKDYRVFEDILVCFSKYEHKRCKMIYKDLNRDSWFIAQEGVDYDL